VGPWVGGVRGGRGFRGQDSGGGGVRRQGTGVKMGGGVEVPDALQVQVLHLMAPTFQ